MAKYKEKDSLERTGNIVKVSLGIIALLGFLASIAVGWSRIGDNKKICATVPEIDKKVDANAQSIKHIKSDGIPQSHSNNERLIRLETQFQGIDGKLDTIIDKM